MKKPNDQSELDKKYFLDEDKYNCPFCNRRSIVYSVIESIRFDWSNDREVWGYLVKCGGCSQVSFHLSNYYFDQVRRLAKPFKFSPDLKDEGVEDYEPQDLDNYFFYHQPSSFFTVNKLVPRKIRELISEAEGCRKMNFLVGASGALRKAIYEFVKHQKAIGDSYEEKIKSLKDKYPNLPAEYFDALVNIQGTTSDELHEKEGSWEPWDRGDFDYLLTTVKAILEEIYVEPDRKKQMLGKIAKLRKKTSFSSRIEEMKQGKSAKVKPKGKPKNSLRKQ